MAYKVLGQVAPAAGLDANLYTVPAAKSSVVSTLTICNRSATDQTVVRVAVRPGGAALSAEHYIIWEMPVGVEDSSFFTLGLTLAAGDIVTVRSFRAGTTFAAFGQEV